MRRSSPAPSSLLLIASLSLATAALPACSQGPEDTIEQSSSEVASQAIRNGYYAAIRDVARANGVVNNAFLLGGIAVQESTLTQCWVDAQWACQGPSSPDCGGGPLIAGGGDGTCAQGGLGLFQFDAGTQQDTLNTYGGDVLRIDGQIRLAVDYVIKMVRDSPYTTNAETYDKARAWLNNFDIFNNGLRDQWVKTVLLRFNGCQPGWSCWSERYPQYNGALQTAIDEPGGLGFWGAGGGAGCPGAKGQTQGAIDAKYRELGGCNSVLGATLTDETKTPDGVGRYNVFERGSIYWKEQTGAHEVHGVIRDKWAELGWETAEGLMGYPITDETKTPDGIGRYNVFERGSIYWTEQTGAHEIYGFIRDRYKDLGWEAGPLGYPTSGEYDVEDGRRNDFQNGSITWNPKTDEYYVKFNAKEAGF